MNKVNRFAGVLCVGQSHSEAVDNFRNAVTGQNAMMYVSQSGTAYLGTPDVELVDPESTSGALTAIPEMTDNVDFSSVSSAGDMQAHYSICLDGCGCHIVAEESVSNCPSCSADISGVDEDRINEHLASEMQAESHSSGVIVVGANAEEAARAFTAAMSTSNVFVAHSSAGSFNSGCEEIHYDPRTGEEVTGVDETATQITSESSVVDGQIEAHMYSCSANCDMPVTISSDEEPVFCAHCSAVLLDVEESESACDDEETDVDIFDDEDGDELVDVEEDEDDEDSESSTSSDGDEDDDDDDDDDWDEDEDDDDEDADDDDDDEDEDDEEDSESSTSAVKRPGIHVSQLSASSSHEEEDEDEDEDLDDDEDDDEDEDDEEDSESSTSSTEVPAVVLNKFDSLSCAVAKHGTLNPALISLSRSVGKVDTVHMFYDGEPLARATYASLSAATSEEMAAKNFNSDNFIKAVSTSVASYGVDKTINDFGFMSFSMDVNVDAVNQANVEAQIQAATANITSEVDAAIASQVQRFEAALSTAMLGTTKGFWSNSSNPVAEALSSAMKAAGIKDPTAVIDRCFVTHAPEFLRQSISRAKSLMSMSEVSQNEIAESVSAAAGLVRQTETTQTVQTHVAPNATQLLNTQETNVNSVSSAAPSSFEEKLKRLSF